MYTNIFNRVHEILLQKPITSSVFGRDGKIIVHYKNQDYSVRYYGHNQEVNCIDSRGELIVSGSRDKTAKVTQNDDAKFLYF